MGAVIAATFRTLVYAALAAVVIQLVRKPADMPPPARQFASGVVEDVRGKLRMSASTGAPVNAPWGSVNSYLATVLQSNGTSAAKSVTFTRAAVAPAGDQFALFAERRVLGVPLYTTLLYRPVSRGGGTGLTTTGASIGRVRLPVWAAGLVETSIGGLDTVLYSELEILRNARRVDITAEKATLHFSSAP